MLAEALASLGIFFFILYTALAFADFDLRFHGFNFGVPTTYEHVNLIIHLSILLMVIH